MGTLQSTGKAELATTAPGVVQMKCIYCHAAKGHTPQCPRYQPPAVVAAPERDAEAVRARMASTHHKKTGVPGTPKKRLKKWKEKNLQAVQEGFKKDKGPDKDDEKGGGSGGEGIKG
jgi:hypothetical protein